MRRMTLLMLLLSGFSIQGCKYSFTSQPAEEAECNPYSVRRLWTACVAEVSPRDDQQFKIRWYVNKTNAEQKRIERTPQKYFIKEYGPSNLTGSHKQRLLSTLTIFNLVDYDSGQYWCQIELNNASSSIWQSERSTVFTLRSEDEYQQMGRNSCTSKNIFFVATKYTCVEPQEQKITNLPQNKSYGNEKDTDINYNQLLSLLLLGDHADNNLTHLALMMSIAALALSSISCCVLAICLVGKAISTAKQRRKKNQRTQINPESSRGYSNRLSGNNITNLHMSELLLSPDVTTTGETPTLCNHLVLTSHDSEDVASDRDSIHTLANMAYDQTHTQRDCFTLSDRESSNGGNIEYDYVDVHNIRRAYC